MVRKVKFTQPKYQVGKLQFHKTGAVRAIFEDGSKVTFKEVPETVVPELPRIEYTLRYHPTKRILYSILPTEGTFHVKFTGFASAPGEEPTPRTHVNRNAFRDEDVEELRTYAFNTIVKAHNEYLTGITVPITIRYDRFVPDEDGFVGVIGRSKPAQLLLDFLEATGVDEIDYKWSDNILPELQDDILNAGKVFSVRIEAGWVTKITPIADFEQPEQEDEVEDEEDEEIDDWDDEEDEELDWED